MVWVHCLGIVCQGGQVYVYLCLELTSRVNAVNYTSYMLVFKPQNLAHTEAKQRGSADSLDLSCI